MKSLKYLKFKFKKKKKDVDAGIGTQEMKKDVDDEIGTQEFEDSTQVSDVSSESLYQEELVKLEPLETNCKDERTLKEKIATSLNVSLGNEELDVERIFDSRIEHERIKGHGNYLIRKGTVIRSEVNLKELYQAHARGVKSDALLKIDSILNVVDGYIKELQPQVIAESESYSDVGSVDSSAKKFTRGIVEFIIELDGIKKSANLQRTEETLYTRRNSDQSDIAASNQSKASESGSSRLQERLRERVLRHTQSSVILRANTFPDDRQNMKITENETKPEEINLHSSIDATSSKKTQPESLSPILESDEPIPSDALAIESTKEFDELQTEDTAQQFSDPMNIIIDYTADETLDEKTLPPHVENIIANEQIQDNVSTMKEENKALESSIVPESNLPAVSTSSGLECHRDTKLEINVVQYSKSSMKSRDIEQDAKQDNFEEIKIAPERKFISTHIQTSPIELESIGFQTDDYNLVQQVTTKDAIIQTDDSVSQRHSKSQSEHEIAEFVGTPIRLSQSSLEGADETFETEIESQVIPADVCDSPRNSNIPNIEGTIESLVSARKVRNRNQATKVSSQIYMRDHLTNINLGVPSNIQTTESEIISPTSSNESWMKKMYTSLSSSKSKDNLSLRSTFSRKSIRGDDLSNYRRNSWSWSTPSLLKKKKLTESPKASNASGNALPAVSQQETNSKSIIQSQDDKSPLPSPIVDDSESKYTSFDVELSNMGRPPKNPDRKMSIGSQQDTCMDNLVEFTDKRHLRSTVSMINLGTFKKFDEEAQIQQSIAEGSLDPISEVDSSAVSNSIKPKKSIANFLKRVGSIFKKKKSRKRDTIVESESNYVEDSFTTGPPSVSSIETEDLQVPVLSKEQRMSTNIPDIMD